MDKHLVATIHTEENARSRYLKITIENSINQIAALIRSTHQVPLVRFYDNSQDYCLFEVTSENIICQDPAWTNRIYEIIEQLKTVDETVRIHNFWMEDRYNNLDMAKQIIDKHNIQVDYSLWEEA